MDMLAAESTEVKQQSEDRRDCTPSRSARVCSAGDEFGRSRRRGRADVRGQRTRSARADRGRTTCGLTCARDTGQKAEGPGGWPLDVVILEHPSADHTRGGVEPGGGRLRGRPAGLHRRGTPLPPVPSTQPNRCRRRRRRHRRRPSARTHASPRASMSQEGRRANGVPAASATQPGPRHTPSLAYGRLSPVERPLAPSVRFSDRGSRTSWGHGDQQRATAAELESARLGAQATISHVCPIEDSTRALDVLAQTAVFWQGLRTSGGRPAAEGSGGWPRWGRSRRFGERTGTSPARPFTPQGGTGSALALSS